MKTTPTRRVILSAFLALITPYSVFAATLPAPVLSHADAVSLNHVVALSGATLHNDDVLQTSAQGDAVLQFGAATASFGHMTLARMANDTVTLDHGYVRVDGAMTINQGRVSVVPAAHSNFEVLALASGKTYVRVYTGSVQLNGLAKPFTVAAGSGASYDAAAPQQQAGVGGGGVAAASGTSVGIAVVVSVVTIAAVVATTAIIVSKTSTSSPTQP
ncbi:MAG TPA: hypothetical protein VN709_09835 [Terriglobales bacterium]|nr:hypothetical protein [Terriglobales bacterium]